MTALLVAFALTAQADPKPDVRLAKPTADGTTAIEVTGVSAATLAKLKGADLAQAEWVRILHIVVAEGTPEAVAARPPVAGTYSVADGVIRFEPQFKLSPGLKYRATFDMTKLPGEKPSAATITAEL